VQRPTGTCWTCDELGHYEKTAKDHKETLILSVTKASLCNVEPETRWKPGLGQTSEWKLKYKY